MYISSRKETPEELEKLSLELFNEQASVVKRQRFNYLLLKLTNFFPSERCRGKKCVIGKACGNLDAKVMFIAEAPGRNGAERTGIPLYGDSTGDNFDKILDAAGLSRKDVYVTNTFLWNPTNAKGNNDKPLLDEIKSALPFLKEQIDIVNPELVVVLGMTAFNSLDLISHVPGKGCSMSTLAGTLQEWNDRCLGVLPHPSPRVVGMHRSLAEISEDLKRILKEYTNHV
jgi:uracil-DNA glycosylase family 4